MAISAVLERTTRLRGEEEDEQLARVAEEHNRRSLESYRALVSESRTAAPRAAVTVELPVEEEAPAVSDYAQAAADYRAVEMPAGREQLFGNIEYRNGELVYADPAATVQTEAEETEDTRPTARTLETLNRDTSELTVPADAVREEAQTQTHVGFLSALSTRAKVAIVAVAMAIVVALVLVFVNTSILNGLNASLAVRQAEYASLLETRDTLQSQIEGFQDPDFVDTWASEVRGMVR